MLKKSRPRPPNQRPQRNVHSSASYVDSKDDVKLKNRAFYQQSFDKYTNYAKESLRSGDRIDAENYFQHAEHYLRFLNERIRYDQEQQNIQNQRNNAARSQPQGAQPQHYRNPNEGNSSTNPHQHSGKRNPIIDSLVSENQENKKEQYKHKIENTINDSLNKDMDGVKSPSDSESRDLDAVNNQHTNKKRRFIKHTHSEHSASESSNQKESQNTKIDNHVETTKVEMDENISTVKTAKLKPKKKIKENTENDEVSNINEESVPS